MDKGKGPFHPVLEYMPLPEYIPELLGGASAKLPEHFLPIEEPNPISSFLRASALKEIDSKISEEEEEENESIYMADPGSVMQKFNLRVTDTAHPLSHPVLHDLVPFIFTVLLP
ncbi:hypothetical protein ACLOJK_003912 [Asimina triloba]